MTALRAFEDKVTNYIRSSKRLSAIFMPLSQSFVNLSGYRKMGFKYDDIICEETPAIQEALKRLSPREYYDRTYRNRRAVQASLRHEVLDHKDWTKPEEDTAYLRPLLRQTEKEAAEKKLWDNGRL